MTSTVSNGGMDTQHTPRRTEHPGRTRPGLPIRAVRDLLTVRRAFGEPLHQGEVTIVPVARVVGGGGYGHGDGHIGATGSSAGSGSGGGLGVRVTPVGVYVVDGASVTWQPALDLNRIILGGQVVGALAVLTFSVALRRRRRRR